MLVWRSIQLGRIPGDPLIYSMLLIVSLPAGATGLPDKCQPPLVSISDRDCLEYYMPAPTPPTAAAKLLVSQAMGDISQAKFYETQSRDVWKRAKAQIEALSKRASQADREAAIQHYVASARALRADMNRVREARNKAIQETIKAYHLEPPQKEFSKDERLEERWRMNSWAPQFSEDEKWDANLGKWRPRSEEELDAEILDNARRSAESGLKFSVGPTLGQTQFATGRMDIFAEAFGLDGNSNGDPDQLAILIHHETVHWVDSVSRAGVVHPEDKFESERLAWSRQADFMKKLGRPGAEGARERARQYGKQAAVAHDRKLTQKQIETGFQYRGWLKGSMPQAGPVRPEPDRVGAEDEFYKDISEGAELARYAKEIAIELMRQKKKDKNRLFEELMSLARRACTSPEFIDQRSLDVLPYLLVPTDYDSAPGYDGEPCPATVYRALVAHLRGGGKFSEDWVSHLGRQAKQDIERKEVEDERRKEEAEAMAKFQALVAEYGFALHQFGPGWIDLRDTHSPWPKLRFERFHFRTFAEARAALFLARSCIDGSMAEPSERALDILRRKSEESGFLAAIKPHYGELESCFDYLFFYHELLGNASDFGRVLEGHKAREKAVKAEIERRERILRESQERARQERARSPRDRDEDGGRGRGNLDLSPADRALERARDQIGRGSR